jgi:hypothetical protein
MSNKPAKPAKRKPLGKPLEAAPDEEFSPEAMRAFGEQTTAQYWNKNAPVGFKNLLDAKQPEDGRNA